jgi:hypothetical protein
MGRWVSVAVIDEAELLNDEAANILLKLLEEPPAKTIIFAYYRREVVVANDLPRVQCVYLLP